MAPRTSRILAPTVFAGWVALLLLGGCVLERETTLSRAARQREVQAMRVERQRLEREREILIDRGGELGHEIAVARAQSVAVAANLRAVRAGLDHELRQLVTAEEDLARAKQRAAAIEQELQPLHELEKTLHEQAALRAAAEQRVKLLREELAAAEAAAAKVTAELQPKLAALQGQLELAAQVEKAIADARAAVQAGAEVLAPTPAAKGPPKKE